MNKCLFVLALLTGVMICASCGKETVTTAAARPTSTTEAPPEAPSKTMPVASSQSPGAFTTSAPIVVENQLDVLAQREGVVEKIRADVGQHVRKGEVLATLDSGQLQAERASLEHEVRAIQEQRKYHESEQSANQADLQRAEKMFAAGLNTKEQLDHVRFYYEATKYQIEQEREKEQQAAEQMRSKDLEIAKMRIVAPFSGVVARRYVHLGQRVSPSERLFWITETAPLRVRFTVPQDAMRSLKKGTMLDLMVPAADSDRHTAKVIAISPVVDPSSGTVDVIAELTGKTERVCPGMTATITVPANASNEQASAKRP
ncbi:MAG TPA: efflux RND transporter periplasmic adaptor subunit [Terriglobales bacterium]